MSTAIGDFKMVLLGHTDVGKSALVRRFVKGQYRDHTESTIGAAYITHNIEIDENTKLQVALWDTAGQERYHSLAPIYYRGAQAALVVYDITNLDSFSKAKYWVRELRQTNGGEMIIGLAGNKADLAMQENKRQVNPRDVADYADEHNLIFMETSAKVGTNVIEIFTNIARQVAAKNQVNTFYKSGRSFSPSAKPNKKGSSICCSNNNDNISG